MTLKARPGLKSLDKASYLVDQATLRCTDFMNPLKSGTLDLALLSVLDGPPRYGLEILQHVNQEFPDFREYRAGQERY